MFPERKKPKGQFDAASEGTMGHQLAEAQLKRHYRQISAPEYNKLVQEVKDSIYYSDEFQRDVDTYCLYVRSQVGDGDEVFFEQRVDYSEWVNSGFGTSDVIIINPTKIRIIDAKFGRNLVLAKDNSQLRLYCVGAYAKFKEKYPHIRQAEYTVMQPRLDNISTEETTIEELINWVEDFVRPRALLAWEGKGEFAPSDDACMYCRAKTHCRARSDFNDMEAIKDFRQPETLSDSELTEVFVRASSIKKWLADVEQYILDRATDDGVVPEGYELGRSKTNRKIEDVEAARAKLIKAGFKEEDIFAPPTLKSIAQLEKLDKEGVNAALGDLIVRPEGEVKLVPAKKSAKADFT
jgi:hypothetical protein